MIITGTLNTQPSHKPYFHYLQVRAINGRSGQVRLRHGIGIVAGQVIAVNIITGVSGRGVIIIPQGNAECPLTLGCPSRIGIQRPEVSPGKIGCRHFQLECVGCGVTACRNRKGESNQGVIGRAGIYGQVKMRRQAFLRAIDGNIRVNGLVVIDGYIFGMIR